jgi:hypothetical protein
MFRHIIAVTAVSLLATGAMAQNTIDRSGTGGDSTIDANAPRNDRLMPEDFDSYRTDMDARWAEYDERMAGYEQRISELERVRDEDAGVVRAGTYPGSTTDANSPTVDRVQPSTN